MGRPDITDSIGKALFAAVAVGVLGGCLLGGGLVALASWLW